MRVARWSLWMAVAALHVWAEPAEGPVIREGRYWVQTVDGSMAFPGGGRLKVSSIGNITVRGETGGELKYTAKKRVRASSADEARRLLSRAQVRASREGSSAMVGVSDPGCERCGFSADLRLTVPRATQETVMETNGGSLEVYDVDGRVNAETAGGAIQMDRIGGSVRAATAGGAITLGTIGGPVRCETAGGPIQLGTARGDAVLTTSGGSIHAEQVDGTLRAETAGGSIHATRVKGNVTTETAGGSIYLSHITGRVNAETAGGSITVESASAGVRADNANGSIKLMDVAGALRASTASGNIWAQLASLAMAESLIEASMGNIVVVIPADLKLTIRANVDVAASLSRIQCDFPEIRIHYDEQRPGPRTLIAEGSLNGGGPLLRIQNTAGTIQIKRR